MDDFSKKVISVNQIIEILFTTTFDLAHNLQKLKEVFYDIYGVF
jgi:hypothetical protein